MSPTAKASYPALATSITAASFEECWQALKEAAIPITKINFLHIAWRLCLGIKQKANRTGNTPDDEEKQTNRYEEATILAILPTGPLRSNRQNA